MKIIEELKEKNLSLKNKNKKLEIENYLLKTKLENKENNKKKLAIDNLEPIIQDDIQDSLCKLKTTHVTHDEDGYAKFLFENFFDKIILIDKIRNKFIYKQIINEKEVVVHDDNLKLLMKEIFVTIQYKVSSLIKDHVEKWKEVNLRYYGCEDDRCEQEDNYRFCEKQIYKIASGIESEFACKILKSLKKLMQTRELNIFSS